MKRMLPLSALSNTNLLRLGTLLFLLLSLFTLTACTKDKDFNTDKKSADFTEQNFEAAALGVVQTALLTPAHLPLFDVLSEQDRPENCEFNDDVEFDEDGYQYECACLGYVAPEEGEPQDTLCERDNKACFSFDAADDGDPVGNKVRARYNHCDLGFGEAYDGMAKFTDTKFEGLARGLVPNSTEECRSSVIHELSKLRASQGSSLEQVNTYTVSGLELIFFPVGPDMQVRVARMEPNGQGDLERVVEDVRTIPRDETAIFVLEDSETTDLHNRTTDGDVVYSLVDQRYKRELCHSMYRTISAKLTDFGMVRDGDNVPEAEYFSAFMNGTLTLQFRTEDFERFSGRIAENSGYSVRIEQGTLSETYHFEDMEVIKGYARESDSFSYNVAGLIDIKGVGKGDMEMFTPFMGRRSEPYFRSGQVLISGGDGDALFVTVRDSYLLRVDVAPEGITSGLNPDYTHFVETPWADLMAREFVFAEN